MCADSVISIEPDYNKTKTEKGQLELIAENPYNIKYIYNPSKKVQLAAVRRDGGTLSRIDNPSEKVQLTAVKHNGYVIQYIHNPSEKVQLAALKADGGSIEYIHNPSRSIIEYVIENYKDKKSIIRSMRIDFNQLPDDLKLILEMN